MQEQKTVGLRRKACNFWLNVALRELAKEEGKESLIELALTTAIKIALDEPPFEEPTRTNKQKEVRYA